MPLLGEEAMTAFITKHGLPDQWYEAIADCMHKGFMSYEPDKDLCALTELGKLVVADPKGAC